MIASLLSGPLDAQARDFLYDARIGPEAFSGPPGEHALFVADSMTWRVFRNPLSLYIGGIAAVLLEFADPRIAAGVWDHSSFRTDPAARIRRTGLAAMVTVYAAQSVSRPMIEGVNRMHGKVTGTTEGGLPYRADDPALLSWVQATASFGFIEAYSRFVRPLSDEEKSRAYGEAVPAAALYGADEVPRDLAGQKAMFAERMAVIERNDIVLEFLSLMQKAKTLPPPASMGEKTLIRAAVEIVPDEIRARLGLGQQWSLKGWERALIARAGRLADQIPLASAPPALACRRLGLTADYLYSSTAP